ncbi:MAG: hypothetical protein DIZ80_02935 [endosymbiont of Galathealinum brachiosum]|uniref:DUF3857 domain-containing protein n=1 Tax=endosymbiont of Galathealinum brachiosum TaxID=2200906 RepID=A0A370DHP5_9GAMM|nr:MAG: hypothetical protein DIZ80_02935 [endosymbiont of Galathealinum brachiosum]
MKKYLFSLLSLFFVVYSASAKEINSLVLFYDEVEQDAGSQVMRYIVNKQYLRIDNGDDNADFILFNVKEKTIYSINHEDRTILKIENHPWQQPEFNFKVVAGEKAMQGAPMVANKQVYSYQVLAGDKICTRVSLVKDMYAEDMKIFYQYQQVLSGQQVVTLKNTPEELHTPCFLIDQVYHSGNYYKVGLPVHISFSRGYEKFLKDFKESKFNKKIFLKPEGYEEYTAAF